MKQAREEAHVAKKKQHRNNQAKKQPAEDTTHQHQHGIVDPMGGFASVLSPTP